MNKPKVDIELVRNALLAEGRSIAALADHLGEAFADAARLIYACRGQVVLTGIGKAGIIGQKISATLASTGTQSIFLHPVEALHGDLGRLQDGDVVVALSDSGQTEELVRLLDHIKKRRASLIAITGNNDSPLAAHADICISYGRVEEVCPLGLAPTVSTICMLALGDALAVAVMRMRDFTPEDFAAFHPSGSLGRKLLKVEEAMALREGEQLSVAEDSLSLGGALAAAEKAKRRHGAMLLVDKQGRLTGILTDADLRRSIVSGGADVLSRPVSELMTADPKRIQLGQLASEAMAIFNQYRIDELPVVDGDSRPVGVIDVQDLIGIKTVTNGRED